MKVHRPRLCWWCTDGWTDGDTAISSRGIPSECITAANLGLHLSWQKTKVQNLGSDDPAADITVAGNDAALLATTETKSEHQAATLPDLCSSDTVARCWYMDPAGWLYTQIAVVPYGMPTSATGCQMADMDTAVRRGNPSQLETDVAECGGTWTSWRVVATDHSCLYASWWWWWWMKGWRCTADPAPGLVV